MMAAGLSKELRSQYGVKSMPVRQKDVVTIVRGSHKGRTGAITACYRRKFCIHVDKISRDKVNGQSVPVNIHPSNVVISTLHLDKDRKALLERKKKQ